MKHPLRKLLITLAVMTALLLILAAAVQIFLMTGIPGKIVLGAAGDALGLRLKADTFRTTWSGQTRIKNLTARKPLKEEPFLQIAGVELNHNGLLKLALTQNLSLKTVQLEAATLHLRQEENSRWNLQEIAERFDRGSTESKPLSSLNLPDISADDVNVIVEKSDGTQTTLGPAQLDAVNEAMRYQFTARIPSVIKLEGRMATARPFAHQLSINVLDLSELAGLNTDITADWDGRITPEGPTGKLNLEYAQVDNLLVTGVVQLAKTADTISARPEALTIEHIRHAIPPVTLKGGSVQYDSQTLDVSNLTARAETLTANLNAQWRINESKIASNGRWIHSEPNSVTHHSGSWNGTAQFPTDGLKTVAFEINGQYENADSRFVSQLRLAGEGPDWRHTLWTVKAPVLQRQTADESIDLGPARMNVTLDWPRVRLERITATLFPSLHANGQYAHDSQTWQLQFGADDLALRPDDPPTDIALHAHGTAKQILVDRLQVGRSDLRLEANTVISLPNGIIENGTVKLSGILPNYDPANPLSRFAAKPWQVNTDISGTVFPVLLNIQGQMQVQSPKAESTDNLSLPFDLRVTPDRISLRSASYVSDRGSWYFRGHYNPAETAGRLFVDLDKIPLEVLSDYFTDKKYNGVLSGRLTADFPSADLKKLELKGNWDLTDFRTKTFAAETMQGQIHMHDGRAELKEIEASEETGTIRGSGTIDLRHTRQADFEIAAENWTYPANDSIVSCIADANALLHFDLTGNQVTGKGRFDSIIQVLGKPAGDLSFDAAFDDKTLYLADINGMLLQGQLAGDIRIPLRDWMDCRMNMSFDGIHLNQLGTWQSHLDGTEGTLSGRLELEPAQDPQPLEPLKFVCRTEIKNGRLHGAPLGGINLTAFLGPRRILVTSLENELLSGRIKAQGRFTRHETDSTIHIKSAIDTISLYDLMRTMDPNTAPIAGVLNGEATIITSPDLYNLISRIDLEITDSDLVHIGAISALYNALSLNFGKTKPEGFGNIKIRSEGSAIKVASFYYFNRGIEVRGSAMIDDIHKGLDSPIRGIILGTTRPLKGIRLPGVEELDRLMGSLQKGAAVVLLEGTLKNPQPKVVPFPQASREVRQLLWGQLRSETR